MSKKKDNSLNIIDERSTSLKMFSIGSVAIVLAFLIIVNVLLYMLLDKHLRLDLTTTDQNFVSESTVDYIKSLPADTNIRIVGLFDEPTAFDGSSSFAYVGPLLEDLQLKSDGKVTVEYINPQNNPMIMQQIDPDSVVNINGYSVPYVINCNGKVRAIDLINDCFTYDTSIYQTTGELVPLTNKVEQVFVNTIYNLTSQSSAKVYFLSGIQEKSHAVLDGILGSFNAEVEELPVTGDFKVPDDCDLLIINNPDQDISEIVQEGIKEYIHNGKRNANLIVSVGLTSENANEEFPNLNNVLAEFNTKLMNGIVMDNDPKYIISSDSKIYAANLDGALASTNSNGAIIYYNARPVASNQGTSLSVEATPCILTSDSATYVENNSDEPVIASDITIGMSSIISGNFPAKAYVFGTSTLTSDDYLAQSTVSVNDTNVVTIKALLNSIITPELSLDVPSKTIADYSIDSTKINSESVAALSIIFLTAIPILCVTVAAVVYHRRKHL